MKSVVAIALGAALLLSTSVAWSQDGKPQPEQRRSGKPGSMNARLDEQIRKLQALHERLTATAATPEERQKAMSDARIEMQASIAMMRQPTTRSGPSGEDKALNEDVTEGQMPGRRGGGSASGGFGGGGGHSPVAAKKTEMMLMMMQLIVDQQALLAAPSASDAALKTPRPTAKSEAKSAKSSDATPKK